MTCDHTTGDPACSSTPGGWAQAQAAREREDSRQREAKLRQDELLSRTPDPDVYEVIRVEEIGMNLVMEVRYSSCTKCAFDAKKVVVFLNTSLKTAILWKRIDPHFTNVVSKSLKDSPPPRARFPADNEGWADALTYARGKTGVR